MPKRSPSITTPADGMDQAVALLRRGGLVGMPTETVYGLAADATNAEAIARIYAAKQRPMFNPLIAHVPDIALAQSEGVFDARALLLAERFWPGPLTLIVPARSDGTVAELARAGLGTIGIRMPAHPVARELLTAFGRPLAAPSANPSGRISPTSAEDVAGAFGSEVAMVLDGGQCQAGIESTILSVLPDEPARILRPGAIAREALAEIVGPLSDAVDGVITAPGQLSSHYAPRASVRLNVTQPTDGEVFLGFGENDHGATLNLSRQGDLVEAASNLYQMLRQLDAMASAAIAVAPIPETGLGEAINDRLMRAAAPRETGA